MIFRKLFVVWVAVVCVVLLTGAAIREVVTDGSYTLRIQGLAAGQYTLVDQAVQFYLGTDANQTYNERDGTQVYKGEATVWDDMRIVPAGFDRSGTTADPTLVTFLANTMVWEFATDDVGFFTVQIPHGYKTGSNMYAHVHWSAGANGNEESAALVGWKVNYSVISIGGVFGATAMLDLSDVVTGTDYLHEISPDVVISGSGLGISSIIIGNVTRTDTGTDDTWAGTGSGSLPLLLELDFHYEMDTVGSRGRITK